MTEPLDPKITQSAMGGDPLAMNAVATHFRPAVYRYCRAHLPDPQAADDVTQEVLMAMIQALPRHQAADHSVAAFVFGIAANKVAMWHRASYRRPEDLHDVAPDRADPSRGPSEVVEADDAMLRIDAALSTLPGRLRQILLMRIAAGLSAEETGQVLGMSPGAVRVAQHRALASLRQSADLEALR